MALPTLDDLEVEDKKVLVRVDINSPLDPDTLDILDTSRIRRVLPTLQELLDRNCAVVVLAHQGRPGDWDFMGLEPHARALSHHLGVEVDYVDDVWGEKAQRAVGEARPGQVLLLGNVRGFEGERDTKSPEEHARSALVQALAPLVDVYVNDAFAAAHRAHCSLVGFIPVLPSCAGRLLEREVSTLTTILERPARPNLFVFGGAKYGTALKVTAHLLETGAADAVLLGGVPGSVFAFPHLAEGEERAAVRHLLHTHGNRLMLPADVAIDDGGRREVSVDDLDAGQAGRIRDIGAAAIEDFSTAIGEAGSVLMSGPLGVFEEENFARGTREVMQAIARSRAFSVLGGGHTVAAAQAFGVADEVSYVSTGGGSLERFLMGQRLPVIAALEDYGSRKH